MHIQKRRILMLGYGTLVMLCLGLIYGWSIFVAPLEAEFGWLRSETSMTFTISMTFFCLGGVIASVLARKIGIKVTFAIAAALILLGFFVASRVETVLMLYLGYGVSCGAGVGMAYNVLLGIMSRYFPDKPAFASGVLLMGFGCGGMVLGTIATSLMDSIGWRSTFLMFGLLFFVVVIVAAIFMRMPREGDELPAPKVHNRGGEGLDLPPKQIIKRKAFWLQFLWASLLPAGGLIIIGNAAPIFAELGADSLTAALGVGVLSVSNGLGRVILGIVYDKFGRNVSVRVITAGYTLAILTIILAWQLSSIAILFVAFIIMGMAYGSVPTMSPAFIQDFYGRTYFGTNLSIFNLSIMASSFGGPPIASAIHASIGSYSFVPYVMLAFVIAGTIVVSFVKKP